MAAGQKKPEEKNTETPDIDRLLRDDAEKQISSSPKISPDLKRQTTEKFINELEMQAEDLRIAHIALEESRDKYLQLYKFAPIGYLTLNNKAMITDVNLTGATLLGIERNKLLKARFRKFIVQTDFELWDQYFITLLKQDNKQSCNLTLTRGDGAVFPARLEGVRITGSDGTITGHIAISNITELKRAEENLVATLKRTKEQQAALSTISFSPHLFSGDVHGLSARLTEISSGVLEVERASVWLFNSKGDELRCIDLYEVMFDRHSYNKVLKRSEYVNEFDTLNTAKFIDAHDPLNDPRTAGYLKGYLKSNRITSKLDAVIRVSGQNLGILSFEHVDRPHHWESDEISFACQLADQIAITLLNRDRKRAEDALYESEIKYRTLFDNSSDAILIHDMTGKILDANKVLCDRLGYSRDELLLMTPMDFDSPPYAKLVYDRMHQLMKKKHQIFETCNVRKDGTSIPTEINVRIIEYEGKQVCLCVGRDITERKKAEDALRESEEKHRILLEEASDPIFSFTPEGQYMYVNPAFAEGVGKPVEEIIGKSIWDIFQKEEADKRFASLSQVFFTGEKKIIEVRVPRETGDRFYVTTIAPVKDTAGKVIFAICSSKDLSFSHGK
jgi:PAS domain S-box-containing protein